MIKDLKIYMTDRIINASKVIIVPHNKPDFDAIGSAAGITLIAKKFKKESRIIVNDNIDTINNGARVIIEELNNSKDLVINKDAYKSIKDENDLFILTDVNTHRLISVSDLLIPRNTIVIDHHDLNEESVECDYRYIDTKASSASEIITKLLNNLKIKIPSDIATYLLAGIHLDTARLSKNTSSETFKIVSKLLDYKADGNRVTDFFVEDFYSDRKVQSLVNRLDVSHYTIGTIIAGENELVEAVELAKAADYSLRYGLDAVFALGRIDDDTISISSRSHGKVNVGEVMKEFDGGGHKYSGAAKIKDASIEEVGTKLKKLLKNPYYIY